MLSAGWSVVNYSFYRCKLVLISLLFDCLCVDEKSHQSINTHLFPDANRCFIYFHNRTSTATKIVVNWLGRTSLFVVEREKLNNNTMNAMGHNEHNRNYGFLGFWNALSMGIVSSTEKYERIRSRDRPTTTKAENRTRRPSDSHGNIYWADKCRQRCFTFFTVSDGSGRTSSILNQYLSFYMFRIVGAAAAATRLMRCDQSEINFNGFNGDKMSSHNDTQCAKIWLFVSQEPQGVMTNN